MADDVVQLDLTQSLTEVPQANSLPLFIRLLESVHRGTTTTTALAEALGVEERTVNYYVDFGRWLHMLATPTPGQPLLTATGRSFVESVPSRGRLFASAMFARELVKTVQSLKRESTNEDELETIDTREACRRAIRGMTDLAQNTAERRASGLAQMLEAAYHPSKVDWTTGERRPEFRRRLEYEGRSFLLSLGALQFSGSWKIRIGFLRQVRVFVERGGHGLNARVFRRASFDLPDTGATWFGTIPVNPSTVELASRGGRDLRRFLATTSPHMSLLLAVLTQRDAGAHVAVKLTRDMYGLRLWAHDRELGAPLEVVRRVAAAMGIATAGEVPPALQGADADDVSPGDDEDLVEAMVMAGFLRLRDTTYTLAPGVEAELRESHDEAASVAELLAPAYDACRAVKRP